MTVSMISFEPSLLLQPNLVLMVEHHYTPKCPVEILDCCVQVQGHTQQLFKMPIALCPDYVSEELLNLL